MYGDDFDRDFDSVVTPPANAFNLTSQSDKAAAPLDVEPISRANDTECAPVRPDPPSSGDSVTQSCGSDGLSMEERLWQAGAACVQRDVRECVRVECRSYQWLGHLLCLCLVVGLTLSIAQATGSWCDPEFATFWNLVIATFAVDFAVMQPVFVAAVYLSRWLVQEPDDDDDEENVEENVSGTGGVCGHQRVRHDLHPIHGQWRYVGPFMHNIDFDDAVPDAINTASTATDIPVFRRLESNPLIEGKAAPEPNNPSTNDGKAATAVVDDIAAPSSAPAPRRNEGQSKRDALDVDSD
jgi:hypothetical protein